MIARTSLPPAGRGCSQGLSIIRSFRTCLRHWLAAMLLIHPSPETGWPTCLHDPPATMCLTCRTPTRWGRSYLTGTIPRP
ncbi:hypothetical protein OQ496_12480 [Acetobacter suratthaniensis]|uniref:Uncharacterized protein n=1 Tax=Acetobacter suratthaniensis TaxID=1502841 RepID=A0ABS3LPD0_9PROT|nr:hypothetical protein [Acetobacter suratthaniensis]MBO1329201.1 hypothetical protein [Acetobacter suratthaniensis]MCX2567269.1 hypothetical protein [Acetobacter suratthaniensis]